MAICKLKNNKAPGDDNLSGEFFKTGSEELLKKLHRLIAKYSTDKKLFRFSTTAYKIFSLILAERLQPMMENF
jgi:hypothetical protein